MEWNASLVKVNYTSTFCQAAIFGKVFAWCQYIHMGHKKQATALVSKMMLMEYFISNFKELNQRGVFSGPANLSRLKTQLGLEANKR